MMKKFLMLLIITPLIFVSCSESEDIQTDKNSNSNYTYTPPEVTEERLVLSNDFVSATKYVRLEELLFLPNKADNNELTTIPFPDSSRYIKASSLVNNYDYIIESMTLIDDTLYFTNTNDSNSIYKFNYLYNEISKVKDAEAYNLTASNNILYYINSYKSKNLMSFNLETNTTTSITTDKVGKYVLSNDLILYQNLSDSSNLYSINIDGTNRRKLTDYSVDSFVSYNNLLYIINSSDNNSLYILDPITNTSSRVAFLDGANLKINGASLYFTNTKTNSLHTINLDDETNPYSISDSVAKHVNDYYIIDNTIFAEVSDTVNQTYVIKLSDD